MTLLLSRMLFLVPHPHYIMYTMLCWPSAKELVFMMVWPGGGGGTNRIDPGSLCPYTKVPPTIELSSSLVKMGGGYGKAENFCLFLHLKNKNFH